MFLQSAPKAPGCHTLALVATHITSHDGKKPKKNPAQTPWCGTPPKGAAYNTPRRKSEMATPSDKPNLDGFSTGPKPNERGGVGSADFGLGRESELGSKVSSGLCCVAIEYFSVDSHRGTSHFTTRLYDLSPVKCQLRMKCKMRLNSILRPQSANLRVAPSLSNLVC